MQFAYRQRQRDGSNAEDGETTNNSNTQKQRGPTSPRKLQTIFACTFGLSCAQMKTTEKTYE